MAARGQHFLARERFDTAVGLRDDQSELWIARGRNQVALGDYGGAFGSYSSALDLDRTNREALDAVGRIALLAGKTAEAERIANQILTLAPDDASALYVRGTVQLQSGRLEAAAATIDQGLRSNPNNDNILVLKSRLLAQQGDLVMAERTLRPVFDQQSVNPLVFGQLAEVYGRQFAGRQALMVRARAAKTSPDDANTLYAYGKQLLATGRVGDGIRMIELSIKRENKPSPDRSVLLALAESNADADVLATALAAQPSLIPATRIAGARYAILVGRPQAARSMLHQVRPQQRTQDWSAVLAYALARHNSPAAAARVAGQVLQKDARSNFALVSRALVAGESGRLDEALRDARLAASDAPRQVEPTDVLATILALRGDIAGARATHNESFNRNRDNVLFLRALVLSRAQGPAQGMTQGATQVPGMSDLRPIVRDFTIRNPAIIAGWVLRRSVCLAGRDLPCAARASAIAKSLAGETVTIPPPPPEEREGPPIA